MRGAIPPRQRGLRRIIAQTLSVPGAALGFKGLAVPRQYGGEGADVLTQTLVIEELSAGDAGVSKVFSHCWKAVFGLLALATGEQAARVIPGYLEDPRYLLGIAITEPDAGSDNTLPYDDPSGGPRLSAVRIGRGYVLNGLKHFIALGAQSKMFTVFARTDKTVGLTRGMTAFMFFPPAEGFEVGRLHDKLGLRLYPQHELLFRDVWVPEGDRLGEEGKAHSPERVIAKTGTTEAAATVLGIGRRAYELAREFARERVQGGRPIIQHTAIGFLLLEMFTRLEAARTLLWRAAWSLDRGGADDPKLARAAKVLAVEATHFITTRAVEILGGMGVMKEAPVEKLYRDAILFYHMGATNQVNLLKALPHL
ncbi:MAG: acyl-CoA dehydrogenase family protein [Nitrospinota bacterium]